MNISTCVIQKNEMPHCLELINQLSQFSSEVIIIDTGSTDGFRDISTLIELPKNVLVYYHDWEDDFSKARNYSFSKATGDYIFWVDMDDYLSDHLLTQLKSFSEQTDIAILPDMIDIPYQYWIDRPDKFLKMRLFKRSMNLHWEGRIHESMIYDLSKPIVYFSEDSYIIHKHRKEHTDRNLKIFHSMDSNKELFDSRDLYYYAIELFNSRYFVPAYMVAQECAMNSTAYWVDRINSLNLCKELTNRMSYKPLVGYQDIAVQINSDNIHRPDLHCILGDRYMDSNNLKGAVIEYEYAIKLGLPDSEGLFLYNTMYHTWYPYAQLTVCYYNLGLIDKAKDANSMVLKFDPNNSNALYNLQFFK